MNLQDTFIVNDSLTEVSMIRLYLKYEERV